MQVRQQSSLVTCLSELVPVPVRRQIVYPEPRPPGTTTGIAEINLPARAVTGQALRVDPPSALYTINNKLLLEPKARPTICPTHFASIILYSTASSTCTRT